MDNQLPTLTIPTAPPPPPPQKKASIGGGKLWLIIFFVIIVVVYAGIFYFYLFKPKDTLPPVPQTQTTNIPANPAGVNPTTQLVPLGELQTYTNQDNGYTVSFPKSMKFLADKNIDKALPAYFGSFRLDINNNPKAFEVNVFHNLGMNIQTVAEYNTWCKGLETQLEKSNYRRRPGCTPTLSATQTELHGYKAFKTVISSQTQIATIYYIPHETKVYQIITTYKQNAPTEKTTFDQIVDSFTFIN